MRCREVTRAHESLTGVVAMPKAAQLSGLGGEHLSRVSWQRADPDLALPVSCDQPLSARGGAHGRDDAREVAKQQRRLRGFNCGKTYPSAVLTWRTDDASKAVQPRFLLNEFWNVRFLSSHAVDLGSLYR